jgi:hypothetical protein
MASTLDCMNINLLHKNIKNGFFNKNAKKKCIYIKENWGIEIINVWNGKQSS